MQSNLRESIRLIYIDFPRVIFNISPILPKSHSISNSRIWLPPRRWIRTRDFAPSLLLHPSPSIFHLAEKVDFLTIHPENHCPYVIDSTWLCLAFKVFHDLDSPWAPQSTCSSRVSAKPTSFRMLFQILPHRSSVFLCHILPCAFRRL